MFIKDTATYGIQDPVQVVFKVAYYCFRILLCFLEEIKD